jgi:hypothetical protein
MTRKNTQKISREVTEIDTFCNRCTGRIIKKKIDKGWEITGHQLYCPNRKS